jgi:excisionase family DNA binding protein
MRPKKQEARSLEQLLDTKQAGEKICLSPYTVRELVRRGELKHIRIGRKILFDPRDVAEWLAAKTRAPQAKGA